MKVIYSVIAVAAVVGVIVGTFYSRPSVVPMSKEISRTTFNKEIVQDIFS